MILLVPVIGLPSVGKSYFCNFLCDILSNYQVIHLQYDMFISDNSLSVQELQSNKWKLYRNALIQGLELFLNVVHKGHGLNRIDTQSVFESIKYDTFTYLLKAYSKDSNKKCVILIDDNFFYRSMRYEIFKIAKANLINFATVTCHCDINILINRFLHKQNNEVSIESLMRMSRLFEFGKNSKWEKLNFDLDTTISYDLLKIDFIQFLEDCFSQLSDLTTSFDSLKVSNFSHESASHKLDQMLRKCVNELMKHADFRTQGKEICKLKKNIFEESQNDPVIMSKLMYGEEADDVAIEEMKLIFMNKLRSLNNIL